MLALQSTAGSPAAKSLTASENAFVRAWRGALEGGGKLGCDLYCQVLWRDFGELPLANGVAGGALLGEEGSVRILSVRL